MRKAIRSLEILKILIFANACSHSTNALPTLLDIIKNSFIAYDETVLSGKQVDKILNRYTDFVSIIVVKNGKDYVFGGEGTLNRLDLQRSDSDTLDKENVINLNTTYNKPCAA
ncbi:hypothetical protein [Paenibacillus illinoisensis]|uniref:hypothetical protein n=1 Tax=Paenibacillus illinoisensis TaxID=59845 RepID=UPI003D969DBE